MPDHADSGRYERWTPLPDVGGCLDFTGLRSTHTGLEVLVYERPSRRRLRVWFPWPRAFRSADEGDRTRTLETLNAQGVLGWTFLIVRDSSWFRWFGDESMYGALVTQSLVHYAIFTSDDCIDVLSDTPPTVEWTGEFEPLPTD